EIDEDIEPRIRSHDSEEFGEREILVSVVIKGLDRQNLVEEILLPRNLLGGAPHKHHALEVLGSCASPQNHLVGKIQPDYLSPALLTVSHQPREDSRRPTHSTTQVEYSL